MDNLPVERPVRAKLTLSVKALIPGFRISGLAQDPDEEDFYVDNGEIANKFRTMSGTLPGMMSGGFPEPDDSGNPGFGPDIPGGIEFPFDKSDEEKRKEEFINEMNGKTGEELVYGLLELLFGCTEHDDEKIVVTLDLDGIMTASPAEDGRFISAVFFDYAAGRKPVTSFSTAEGVSDYCSILAPKPFSLMTCIEGKSFQTCAMTAGGVTVTVTFTPRKVRSCMSYECGGIIDVEFVMRHHGIDMQSVEMYFEVDGIEGL